jgi:hypothetical protein
MMNASDKYMMMGEPNVRNEAYIKNRRMDEVAIPILSPNAAHTPKAYFSKND